MIATLFSLITAFFFMIIPTPEVPPFSLLFLSTALIFLALATLVTKTLLHALSFSPLHQAERHFTPYLLEIFSKDSQLFFIYTALNIFILMSFTLGSSLFFYSFLSVPSLLALCGIFCGGIIDLFHTLLSRTTAYLNPLEAVKIFSHQGLNAIQKQKNQELALALNALTEIGIKAIQTTRPSLANQAIDQLQLLMKTFLETSKSRLPTEKGNPEKESAFSYTLYSSFQQLEYLWNASLKNQLELTCSHLLTVMSKIVVYCAHYEMTLTSHPLYFIHKFIKESQHAAMPDLSVKASLALLEVARVIGTELDITSASLQETFFTLISQLEEIAKEAFKQDKSTNIKILTQPLRELKELFKREKLVKHHDTPVILADIERVLGEFEALELVMKTLPPLPNFDVDSEKATS